MSQHWHAHWAEDAFKPTRLQNWEVPRWHPTWPVRHCTVTAFIGHKNGRIFGSFKKPNHKWSDYKGTWELPLKIDRKTAEELSKSTEHKKQDWNAYKKRHNTICAAACKGIKKSNKKMAAKKEKKEKKDSSKKEITEDVHKIFAQHCKISRGCKL